MMGLQENFTETTAAPLGTFSFIPKPIDSRCHHWTKILSAEEVSSLLPENCVGGNDLPGSYIRDGVDLELPIGTFVFDGEAVHHRKVRGYNYNLGVVLSETEIVWMRATNERKSQIKDAGARHLMGGSGGVAGMIRMARWILEGDIAERTRTLKGLAV